MGLVGDEITATNASWSFGGAVAKTFDAHVSKSVPFYGVGHDLTAKIADYFLYDGALAYELGCSTGELTRQLALRNAGKQARFIGIDCEAGMIEAACAKCAELNQVSFVHADLRDVELEKADLILAYYTMQFIRPAYRQAVFDRIYQALNWGGAFVMFEKVRAPDARFQDMASALYNDYKLEQGYNEAEIVHKTRSLKGVLGPFSSQGNLDMLGRAGFADVTSVFKYVCFEGFLAIK
ncbi:methyltransferase domain-containing protein [Marinivivus vitaminiproducens]|uniref:methyltransferase domain-containing protein n=1 Tax=Marinivivus vitaminiproducens TaxID=3035935 RepID=UPI0027A8A3F1|nr:methyltransferase domain-containing protein [Geminicoccaceae bacterium SCSIO 64248]